MSLIVRTISNVTNNVYQSITHVILRDLTNYYWDKQNDELEQQSELLSVIQRNSTDSLLIDDLKDGSKEYIIAKTTDDIKEENNQTCNSTLNSCDEDESFETLNLLNKDVYNDEEIRANFQESCENEKCLIKTNEMLNDLSVLSKESPKNTCLSLNQECNINNSDIFSTNLFSTDETNIKESICDCGHYIVAADEEQICTEQASEVTLSLQENNYNILGGDCKEVSFRDCIQNTKEEKNEIQDDELTNPKSNLTNQIIECEPSYIAEKSSQGENSSDKSILSEKSAEVASKIEENQSQITNDLHWSNTLALSENGLREDFNENSILPEKLSTTTIVLESLNNNETNCDCKCMCEIESEFVEIKKETDQIKSCECSKIHGCLQFINCDEDDLLTDEQLQSVETGSVSDWLYRVRPAICLLPSSDTINVTAEELQSMDFKEPSSSQELKFDQNEIVIKTLYIKQWLDMTEKYFPDSTKNLCGSGDFE